MEQLRADHVKQDRLVRLVLWLTAASLLLMGLIIYLGPAIALSRTDPDRFLTECRHSTP